MNDNEFEENENKIEILNGYNEVFEVELEGWCFGLEHFTGEVHPAVVFRVVKELRVAIREAISNHYIFNVIDVAMRISRAAKYKVEEREIAFCILSLLPNISDLTQIEETVVLQLVDQVETTYGGAIEKVNRMWSGEQSELYNEGDEEQFHAEEESDVAVGGDDKEAA